MVKAHLPDSPNAYIRAYEQRYGKLNDAAVKV
jgi:hypothetical protein